MMHVDELDRLAAHGRAALIAPIRQEILSGVRSPEQFRRLQEAISGFRLLRLKLSTYDLAAQCFNRCRAEGVAGDPIDMLICASSIEHNARLFSIDTDYARDARHLNLQLHQPIGPQP